MKKAAIVIAALVLTLVQFTEHRSTAKVAAVGRSSVSSAGASKVDPLITEYFNSHLSGASIPVVITYASQPSSSELNRLQSAGITKGFALQALPMVIADMNATQLEQVRVQP